MLGNGIRRRHSMALNSIPALAIALFGVGPGARAGWAQHEGHGGALPPHESMPADTTSAHPKSARTPSTRLFQSDMTTMAGMTAENHPEPSARRWQWMSLGLVRLVYNWQGGESGTDGVESTNWAMTMAHRPLGDGRITFMLMNSLEPATIPDRGSPQLFQTGETFDDEPLVDRQHPHDFFMHLSMTYRQAIASEGVVWAQLAPVGEPALGPTAFMHRASSGDNPTAPLGHHWQDSSHITSNVVTVGGGWRWLILESSAFHGEEPDEERWDLDGGRLDSASGRLKLRFDPAWSAQVSYGYLHDPEALDPGDLHRTTASVSYGAAGDRSLAGTFVWGRNRENHGTSDSFLLEGTWQVTHLDQTFARLERVDKDQELLATKEADPGNESLVLADITAFTLGYLRTVGSPWGLAVGVGGDVTLYGFPSTLEAAYGEHPLSSHVFLRGRWGEAHAGSGHGGEGSVTPHAHAGDDHRGH